MNDKGEIAYMDSKRTCNSQSWTRIAELYLRDQSAHYTRNGDQKPIYSTHTAYCVE